MDKSFEEFQSLFNQNKLLEAKEFCEAWTKSDAQSDIAQNAYGLVFAKLGKMNDAIRCFTSANNIQPNIAAYHDNLSNAYLAIGDVDKAKQHLFQALKLDPNRAESYNNLGRLLYKQGLFNEAIYYFEKALRIHPDYWESHYNLAHSFTKINQLNRAITHYLEVIRLAPSHPVAHFNLGLAYFEEGNSEAARIHLKESLSLTPENAVAARFLGHTEIALGHIDEAIEAFEKTASLSSDFIDVYHNLAILYLRKKDKEKALDYFEHTLAMDPSNDTARHMIMSLKGEQSSEAPKTYISSLFDQYADYYDKHVKEKLNYKVPVLLRSAMGHCLTEYQKACRALDIGCGTGLCGIYFRDLALELLGIDFSPKMVAQAQSLGAYDKVLVGDFNEYLSDISLEPFNLIIAGDVLVYFGDLETSFKNISHALASEGRFVFTIESILSHSTENDSATDSGSVSVSHSKPNLHPNPVSDSDSVQILSYRLNPTGRFAHANEYIHKLAKQFHFNIEVEEEITPREHEGKAVKGFLFILKKID